MSNLSKKIINLNKTKKKQWKWSRISITYLLIWLKLVKFAKFGRKIVFGKLKIWMGYVSFAVI